MFGRKLTGSLGLAVGPPPGAEDRSSGRSRRRRCCGGSPAGSAGLYASTPLLVPESEGLPSGPHGHWLHGWPGSPSSLLSWLWWGSAWFSSVSLPPQSGGVSLALVAFISRSGGGLFSGLTVTSRQRGLRVPRPVGHPSVQLIKTWVAHALHGGIPQVLTR